MRPRWPLARPKRMPPAFFRAPARARGNVPMAARTPSCRAPLTALSAVTMHLHHPPSPRRAAAAPALAAGPSPAHAIMPRAPAAGLCTAAHPTWLRPRCRCLYRSDLYRCHCQMPPGLSRPAAVALGYAELFCYNCDAQSPSSTAVLLSYSTVG